MNRTEVNVLRAGHNALRDKRHTGDGSFESSRVTSVRDLEEYIRVLFSRLPFKRHQAAVELKLQPNLAVFNVGCALYLHLLTSIITRDPRKPPILWQGHKLKPNPKPGFVLQVLLTNALCGLLGIRELCLCGLDGQARILLRSFVEITDLTIAVVAFEDTFRQFTSVDDNGPLRTKHWRRHLAPSVIRGRLTEWIATAGLDPELLATLKDIRKRRIHVALWVCSCKLGRPDRCRFS